MHRNALVEDQTLRRLNVLGEDLVIEAHVEHEQLEYQVEDLVEELGVLLGLLHDVGSIIPS